MKKFFTLVLSLSILMLTVLGTVSCSKDIVISDITAQEVVDAYESTDYKTTLWDYSSEDSAYDYDYYLIVEGEDSSAYFYFFDNEDDAKDFKKDQEWNPLLWGLSVIYGDPTWVHAKQYGNVVVTYEDSDLIEPFKGII